MAEENKTPRIRFKEFDGEWEAKELVDEVDFFSGLTYSPSNVIKGGGTFVLRSSNVKNGEIVFTDNVYVNSDVVNSENVKVGDIIIVVRNGSRSLIGKHAQVKEKMNSTVIGAFMTGIHSKQPAFTNALLDTAQFNKEIEKNLGATINQITNGAFKKMLFMFPFPNEQTKIGNYFQQLDSLITLHQDKHDKLLNVKKAMLEKMFPKKGADVPEIRFKGFSEKWEERKLLDNIDKIIDFRGRTPKKIGLDWSETGYLALSALNVKNGYIDQNVEAHYGNQNLYDKWMVGNELHKNQVLFTTEAPMGNVVQIPDNKKYILSQRVIAFGVNPSLITEDFLAVMLSLPLMFQKLSSLSSGGTAKGVSQKSLSTVDVFISKDTNEQTKIGNFFKNLDTLLSLHQSELEKLKNIKKACLEKMFV